MICRPEGLGSTAQQFNLVDNERRITVVFYFLRLIVAFFGANNQYILFFLKFSEQLTHRHSSMRAAL